MNLFNIFKKKLIIIPLVFNGQANGQWVECFKGDDTYNKLVKLYGEPLPKQIEVKPVEPEKNI